MNNFDEDTIATLTLIRLALPVDARSPEKREKNLTSYVDWYCENRPSAELDDLLKRVGGSRGLIDVLCLLDSVHSLYVRYRPSCLKEPLDDLFMTMPHLRKLFRKPRIPKD